MAYGGTAELGGALTGLGNTNHGLILQGDPFPYTSSFSTLLGPLLSNGSGHFVFKIAKLTQNTEFRVLTVDTRPLYSSVVTVHVTPKITLRVRPAGGKGRYRLYGTVAPAKLRGTLVIQELKPQKSNSKKEGPRAHTVGNAAIKKGTSSLAEVQHGDDAQRDDPLPGLHQTAEGRARLGPQQQHPRPRAEAQDRQARQAQTRQKEIAPPGSAGLGSE